MRCCYILKIKRVVSEILPDRCISPFYPNFYEYEMLIEREVCLFSVLFFLKITVNSLLRISVISFSHYKNYMLPSNLRWHTPNANMADRSVVARDELHESEASWVSWFVLTIVPQESLASSWPAKTAVLLRSRPEWRNSTRAGSEEGRLFSQASFVVDLVYFLSPSIKVFVFVNTTRTDRNLPQ